MKFDNFNNIAEIYDKYRPKYPEKYIDYLMDVCSLGFDSKVADIGAGTGIFTEQLLNRNVYVYAVEPNDDMRKTLKEKLSENEKIKIVDGTAENTGIENNSINLITATQAFHWFNIEEFRKECKRILKPNGRVSLLWNTLDMKSDIVKKAEEIQHRYTGRGIKYIEVDKVIVKNKRDEMIEEFFKYGSYELKIVENNLINAEEQFIGFNLTKSYSLRENDKNYEAYVEEFRNVFRKYSTNGLITIPNNTYCYLGSI